MISLLDPKVWVVTVVVCAASAGVGYWRGNVNGKASVQAKWDAETAERQAVVAQSFASAVDAAHQASQAYQETKQNEQERIRVVRETVVRTVTGLCFDERSLFHVNQAISGVQPASAPQ